MLTFKEMNLLFEDNIEAIRNFIRRDIDKLNDLSRLKDVFNAISAPLIRQECRDLFSDRGMSDAKGKNAADQLSQKLDDTTIIAQHKRRWLQAMLKGDAIDVRQMVSDSRGKLANLKNSKYYDSSLYINKQDDFIDWFWSWEPPMGGRAVGGGEMLLILSEITGRKGGEGGTGGDVSWSDLAIEVKKAEEKGTTGGAGFGKNSGFQNARSVYMNFINGSSLPKSIKSNALALGFGGMGKGEYSKEIVKATSNIERFSASMNGITIPLVKSGKTPAEVDKMWGDVCAAAMGQATIAFSSTGSDGSTDVNDWMHTWVANGIDAYSEGEGHNLLFCFDPESLSAISFASGSEFLSHQRSGGQISYDYAVSWKEMGYGNYVPRLKVKKYKKTGVIADVKGLQQIVDKLKGLTAISKFLKSPRTTSGKLKGGAIRSEVETIIGAKVGDDKSLIRKLEPYIRKHMTGNVTKILDKEKRRNIVKGLKKL